MSQCLLYFDNRTWLCAHNILCDCNFNCHCKQQLNIRSRFFLSCCIRLCLDCSKSSPTEKRINNNKPKASGRQSLSIRSQPSLVYLSCKQCHLIIDCDTLETIFHLQLQLLCLCAFSLTNNIYRQPANSIAHHSIEDLGANHHQIGKQSCSLPLSPLSLLLWDHAYMKARSWQKCRISIASQQILELLLSLSQK